MPDMMTFWRGNRLDGEHSQDIAAVAAGFWESIYGRSYLHDTTQGAYRSLERTLRGYLTGPDGLNSTWTDEEAFGRLFVAVRESWPVDTTAPCDECGADIPDREPSMVNRFHEESCSLHPGDAS